MNYPKPAINSKRGMHWTASNYPAHANFQWHLDWMMKCGIGWVKYVADGNASAGQGDSGVQFGVECLKRGMIPIHRFYLPANHNWTDANDNAVVACVRAGIRYIEPMNEPDLPCEWGGGSLPSDWLTRAFSTWIYQAQRITALGGIPLSPALASGAFQDRGPDAGQVTVNPFEWIRDAGIINFVCAIHNYTGNHPIDYPYDAVNQTGQPLTQAEYDRYGPEAWDYRSLEHINIQRERDKNSGDTIYNDDSCFLAVLRFRELLDQAGFSHVPIMTTEGGPVHTDLWDGRYPRVVPKLFIEMLEQELAWMAERDWYYCLCPWLWANNAAGGTGGWADCQWFHPGHPWVDSDGFMPVVKWLMNRPLAEDGNTDQTEPTEPEEPEDPMPEPELDNDAESYGVTVVPAAVDPGTLYWKCTRVHHLDQSENNGNHNVYVNVFDDNGPFRDTCVTLEWQNGTDRIPLEKPWPAEPMGNCPLWKGQIVSVEVAGELDSDRVEGITTAHPDEPPGNTLYHHSFLVEWRLTTKAGEAEPEEPEEPEVITADDIRNMAWNNAGIAYNPDAAFAIYAREHGLGVPLTDEFDIDPYRAQGFAGGIVYCVVGDWQNIRTLAW